MPLDLTNTEKVLENQLRAMQGKCEGREPSVAERKTIGTLEEELRAVREEIATHKAAEDRAAKVAAVIGADARAIATFGPNGGPMWTGASPAHETRETADKATEDFRAFIRTGEQRASMSYTDANGGYAVPNPVVAAIIDKLKAQDPILSRARMFPMQGGNTALEIPVVSALGATAWVTETAARAEQNSPTFGQTVLNAYEVFTDWRATQKFIDSVPGIEDWIGNEIVKTILAAAGVKFAVGTGTDEIKGVFANTSSGYTIVPSGSNDALTNTAFPSAYAALAQVFQPNACWVMLPATFGTVLSYVYPNTQTPLVQFVNGEPTIMGKPVLLSDSAPAVGNGAYPVFYGDLSAAYAVGMHQDINILRDPYSAKPYVSFYATARIGGVPLDNQAGVLILSEVAAVS